MEVYIYQADLYCEDCGNKLRAKLNAGIPRTKDTGDSDDFPQGPYPNGGGESDVAQHCGDCGCFLENPLTADGVAYVEDAIVDQIMAKSCVGEWFEHYGFRVTND